MLANKKVKVAIIIIPKIKRKIGLMNEQMGISAKE